MLAPFDFSRLRVFRLKKVQSPILVLALVMSTACGGAQTQNGPDDALLDPRELYPMAVGNTWNYNVSDTSGDPPMLANQKVTEAGPNNEYTVMTVGSVRRYRVNADGIFAINEQAWLLKAPDQTGSNMVGHSREKNHNRRRS